MSFSLFLSLIKDVTANFLSLLRHKYHSQILPLLNIQTAKLDGNTLPQNRIANNFRLVNNLRYPFI